ncbi:DUF397 domain-containing protein [Amycolatopsis nalaikhensis]|uniref:DUF397 domain-containing protein n=1 Tax=Amycolatopsis nalaikhensis TaxID=715472 RepID=A0ABY8XQ92_9PSEU|nr:DUF397 domain-containing protein [Amycolatopsis sp. 2-2]WIV57702.1 DUF397 domain-containing protein [Amycolatopsis sp. 2-2]
MDIDDYDPMDTGKVFAAGGWQRSPLCGPDKGDCVEINLDRPGLVAIRDSKLADSPVLVFSAAEWDTFTRGLTVKPEVR